MATALRYMHKFPKKFASGNAFCNREKERKQLVENILNAQHTLIIAPRRYGKSSLGLKSIEEAKVPFERVDFFIAVDELAATKLAVEGIKNLIAKVAKPTDRIIKKLTDYLRKLQLDWVVGSNGISLQIVEKNEPDQITLIHNMLKFLEHVLSLHQQHAVLFLDEFQELGKLNLSKGLEAAIRNVAESTEYLTFLFSGSSRNLLNRMFNDDNSPLYKLCDRLAIARIAEGDYIKFIGSYAKKTWGDCFSAEAFETIFACTHRHPYYINALCRQIWFYYENNETVPTSHQIQALWDEFVDSELDEVAVKINDLNLSQKKVLIAIANGYSSRLSGKEMLPKLNLSSGAVSKSLAQLDEQDFIESTSEGFRTIDPMVHAALNHFYGDYFS